MASKIVSATVAVALCTLSVQPAMAQDHRFSGFDAPQGANATVNLRVPLGASGQQERLTYGVTFAYGRTVGPATMNARGLETRAVSVADFRFAGGELRNARLGAFDVANPDRGPRMNLSQGKAAWTIFLFAMLALGVVCFLECDFGGNDRPSTYVSPE